MIALVELDSIYKVSQPEAVKACLAMGAELATIETSEEDAFVHKLGGVYGSD